MSWYTFNNYVFCNCRPQTYNSTVFEKVLVLKFRTHEGLLTEKYEQIFTKMANRVNSTLIIRSTGEEM